MGWRISDLRGSGNIESGERKTEFCIAADGSCRSSQNAEGRWVGWVVESCGGPGNLRCDGEALRKAGSGLGNLRSVCSTI